MAPGDKEAAEEAKKKVAEFSQRLAALEKEAPEIAEALRKIMLGIPNIIDPSVLMG